MNRLMMAATALLLSGIGLFAQKSAIFIAPEGAIHGYDPVAYFKQRKAVQGEKNLTYSWSGADWHFSTQQNLDSFKTNPEKYAPQYGGYCAFGLADGHKAPTEPEAWTISGDKLYLNYNKDVQVLWKKKQQEYITTANENWPRLKDKE